MQKIGILGMGLLGRGIAACLLAHGVNLTIYSTNVSEYELASEVIERALTELYERSLLDEKSYLDWRQRVRWARHLDELKDCEFVIESILESLAAKHAVYERLEALLPADTPIATNTSSLPIAHLQAGCVHPERLIGMHWAEPAHATRFLEIVRGPATNEVTLNRTLELAAKLSKEPCVVSSALPGFIANRLGYAIYREALHLLREGIADAETIDRAFRNSVGLWAAVCGPLRWIDLTGGPALYLRAMDNVLPGLSAASSTAELDTDTFQREDRGVLTGKGFYSYSQEEAAEWQHRFHEHVWTICAMQEKNFPIRTAENSDKD